MIKNKCLRHIYCSVVKIKYSVISVTHYLINMIRYELLALEGLIQENVALFESPFLVLKVRV